MFAGFSGRMAPPHCVHSTLRLKMTGPKIRIDQDKVVKLLREQVARDGSVKVTALNIGVIPSNLSSMLTGVNPVTAKAAAHVGYEIIIVYRKKEEDANPAT